MFDVGDQLEALWEGPVALAFLDEQLRFVRVNQALADVIGIPAADHLGRGLGEVLPDVDPLLLSELRRVLATGLPIEIEVSGRTPRLPGIVRRWRIAGRPLRAGGRIAGVAATVVETTELEHRIRFLADAMPHVVWATGPDGGNDYVNARYAAYTGLPTDQLLGERWMRLIHPDDVATVRERWETCRRTGDGFDIEYRMRRADGAYRWQLSRGVPLRDGGRIVRWFGTTTDVHHLKELEEQVRVGEQRLEQTRSFALVMALHVSLDGRWLKVPPTFCEFLGRTEEELIGRSFKDVTHPDDFEADWSQVLRLLSGELRSFEVEKRFVRGDGSVVWGYLNCSVVTDDAGRPVHLLTYVRDIDEQKRAEQALRDSDRRKDEFLSVLSHELRNPLAPIRNSLYVLGRLDPAGTAARRAREVIERQVGHLTRLVDDLLDVTRISKGKVELRRARVDLAEVVRRTAEDHRSLVEGNGTSLELAIPDRPVWVDGDWTRLAQIVANLVVNAAKFTPRGGRVSVSVAAAAPFVELRVRDTGIGMDPELCARAFEPFVQGDRTLARSDGGLGLGLALVKGLAELHGGTVAATSAGRGRGSELVVRLPAEVEEDPQRPALEPIPELRARRVLVVDDNVDAAETLADLVRAFGHEASVAFDGDEAVTKARTEHPDVVLCDIGLPGMDGYGVARLLRTDDGLARTRLVALSGYAQPEDLERSADAGFELHLAKPADPEAIERLLR